VSEVVKESTFRDVDARRFPELDDPDVNEEEDALLPEIVETVFTDPVEPRRIELGVPLVKLVEPDINLDPLDELSEEPADAEEDPLADPVLKDEDPWLEFKDDTELKVELRPLLTELEPTFRDPDALLSAELDELEDPLVKLDEPDANLDPLEELTEEPADAEDDPRVIPVLSDAPLLALKVEIDPLLAELEDPELNETDEPRLSVEANPE